MKFFSSDLFELLSEWRDDGRYNHVSILNKLLHWECDKACYPDTNNTISFSAEDYSIEEIIEVLAYLNISNFGLNKISDTLILKLC